MLHSLHEAEVPDSLGRLSPIGSTIGGVSDEVQHCPDLIVEIDPP